MIYGYARVSTKGQASYGNGMEEQVKELRDRGVKKIYKDSYTGTVKNRPELEKLLSRIKPGDRIIVTKLDRIARSVKNGIEILEEIINKDCSIEILNMGVFENTPTGRLMINVMFSFAEFERDMILQRTSEGKEIARQKKGYKEGRPVVDVDFAKGKKLIEEGKKINDVCKILGISKKTWYNKIKENVA